MVYALIAVNAPIMTMVYKHTNHWQNKLAIYTSLKKRYVNKVNKKYIFINFSFMLDRTKTHTLLSQEFAHYYKMAQLKHLIACGDELNCS